MKATLTKRAENARNMDRDKERINTLKAIGTLKGELRRIAEARFYMARRSDGASPVYCSLWVHGDCYTSGRGKASGYGYHKESAALQAAIDSASITLEGPRYNRIDGVGGSAMREAMDAIAIAAGAEGPVLIDY